MESCKLFHSKFIDSWLRFIDSMSWHTPLQATEAVKRAKRTLILTPENPSADAIAAVAALLAFFKRQTINAEAFIPGINKEKLPAYLQNKDEILSRLGGTRDMRISLKVDRVPIQELIYDVKDGRLDIFVTPKNGEWKASDVSVHPEEDKYDLIITIGCADRNALGVAFQQHADFIYRTPVINLDFDPRNEHWGAINMVDMTACSATEVVFEWLTGWDEKKIDPQIATALLSGMIANTHSFRTPRVTPLTLDRASKLIAMGAEREAVVHHLWRTREVSTLKLWGRALTRLEQDEDKKLVWTTLSKQDIIDSGTTEARLDELVQELIAYAPNAKIVAIFVEHDEHTTRTALFAQPPHDAALAGRALGLDGNRERVSGAIAKPLLEAKEHAVKTLREQIK